MPNEIKSLYGTSTSMTITLASLASSTAGVGRQSSMVANNSNTSDSATASDRYEILEIFFKITTGTSPTADRSIQFYLLQGDNPASSNIRTDGAGATDAGITIVNAPLVFVVPTDSTSNKTYRGSFKIRNPGPEWGLAVVHNTGVALNATAGNFDVRFVGLNPEVS